MVYINFLFEVYSVSLKTNKLMRTNGKFLIGDFLKRISGTSDKLFYYFTKSSALLVLLTIFLISLVLFIDSIPSLRKFGFTFLYSTIWDPVSEVFGSLPVIYGTAVSSFLALIMAVPLSICVSLFLTELVSERISKIIGFLIETLAAIPSVIYGLWGLFVLAPWLRNSVEPFLSKYFGFFPFFTGPPYGVGMLSAGIILAIMITPTISSISREVFLAVPRSYREAALAIGATRYEMMKVAVLKNSYAGIFGASIMGLGRAIGETMAVTMVIGNKFDISVSLFAPSQTMASLIANEYAEAVSDLHLCALAEVGLVLFLVTFLMNGLARKMVSRIIKRYK